MKGILLLNGEPYAGKIDAEGAFVVCCDGAYDWAKGRVRIDETVGDFDSLSYCPTPPPKRIYPAEKDDTDGGIALEMLLLRGVDEIEIYGDGGGREDHFLGNLHLLYASMRRGVKAVMRNNGATLFLARGKTRIRGESGQTVSLLPFGGDARVTDSEGLFYPLRALDLPYGSRRGISNRLTEEEASFDCTAGQVLVVLNDVGRK